MMHSFIARRVLAALVVMCWSAQATAAVGKILFVVGGASVERGQTATAAQRGFEIDQGDVLVTGLSGRMHVRMGDGALISLRPDTRFQVEAYELPSDAPPAAAPDPTAQAPERAAAAPSADDLITERSDGGSGRALLSLIKGGFRTITGLIGKTDRSSYQVKTPVATIGIRGTDWSAYQCTGDCANPDALYFSVWNGAISVESEGGTQVFSEGNAGVVINASSPPQKTASADPRTVDDTPEPDLEEDADDGETTDESGGTSAKGNTTSADASDTTTPLPEDDNRPVEPAGTDDPDDTGEPINPRVTPAVAGTGPFRGTSGFTAIANSNLVEATGDGATRFRNGHPDGTAVYSIGSASSVDVGFDPDTGIRWGRWAGGTAQVAIAGGSTNNLDLSQQSLHYIFGPTGDSAPAMPITGSAEYTLVGNTNPTDGNGNVGVLGSASLAANFTDQTVDSSVNLFINEQAWNASGSGSLLNGSNLFAGDYASVSVGGSTEGNSGVFSGFFGADASGDDLPDGAGLIYNLTNGSDAVTGAAVFGDPSP